MIFVRYLFLVIVLVIYLVLYLFSLLFFRISVLIIEFCWKLKKNIYNFCVYFFFLVN